MVKLLRRSKTVGSRRIRRDHLVPDKQDAPLKSLAPTYLDGRRPIETATDDEGAAFFRFGVEG